MMNSKLYEKFADGFYLICLISTAGLLIWCLMEYGKNENVVQFTFKRFGSSEKNVYPDISFCLQENDIFSMNELKKANVDAWDYSDFLEGKIWKDTLNLMDYETLA